VVAIDLCDPSLGDEMAAFPKSVTHQNSVDKY